MRRISPIVILSVAAALLLTSCSVTNRSMHNESISFYGQVVDEDNKPISGVKVAVAVRHWHQPDIFAFMFGAKEIHLTQRQIQTVVSGSTAPAVMALMWNLSPKTNTDC